MDKMHTRPAQFLGENLDKLHSEAWAKTWMDTNFGHHMRILPRQESSNLQDRFETKRFPVSMSLARDTSDQVIPISAKYA